MLQFAVVAFAQDRHALELGVEVFDVGAFGGEAVLHHQQAVDGFLGAGGPEGVARQRLGRGDHRHVVAEDIADRPHLLGVADRGRGAVRVEVVDLRIAGHFQRDLHAALGALARGGDHVIAVGIGPVAGDLGIDGRAARQGPFILFQHHDARAAGDDEAVAVLVIGPAGDRRRFVEVGRHGPHGVEHVGHRPVDVLAAAGEDHVLLAPGDLFGGRADAVGGCRAGRGDRIVDPLELEPGGQHGRGARGHGLGHGERPDPLGRGLLDRGGGGLEDDLGRGAAFTDDQADPLGLDLLGGQAGVLQRLLEGDMAPGGAVGEEAGGAAVDVRGPVLGRHAHRGRRPDLGTEAVFDVVRGGDDAGTGLAQGGGDLILAGADGGDDAQTGDDDTPHESFLPGSEFAALAAV